MARQEWNAFSDFAFLRPPFRRQTRWSSGIVRESAMETAATPKTVKARVLRRVAPVRPIEAGRVYTAKGLQTNGIRAAEITKLAQEFCWTLKTPPAKATISLFWLRENGFEALVPSTADDIAVVVSRRVKWKEEDVLSLRFEQLVHYEEILFTSPPLARVVLNEFEVKEKTGVSVLAVMKKLYDRSVFIRLAARVGDNGSTISRTY